MSHPPADNPAGFQREPGAILAGRYRLEEPIGRGAMGEVWRATHTKLNVSFAVKLVDLTHPAAKEVQARFEHEARAAAQLQSPNTVRITDYGVEGTLAFLVMEMLSGETLQDRMTRVGSLSPGRVCAIVSELARGLSAAHALGIVHRDLKPQNVFLANAEGAEVAKVLDFGVARTIASADTQLTRSDTLIGTPAYMSPEQTMGNVVVDHRSDLWQLGVLAFECMCGQRLFKAEGISQLFFYICQAPMPVPSQVRPGIPQLFDIWFARAVARDPQERFQSAEEMADDLRRVIPPVNAVAIATSSSPRIDPVATPLPPLLQTTTGAVAAAHEELRRKRERRILNLVAGMFAVSAVVLGIGVTFWLLPKKDADLGSSGSSSDTGTVEGETDPMAPEQLPAVTEPNSANSAAASPSATPSSEGPASATPPSATPSNATPSNATPPTASPTGAPPTAPPPPRYNPEQVLGI